MENKGLKYGAKFYVVGLVFLALFPASALAQRHGRSDAIQNYMRSLRSSNPQLALHIDTDHKWLYFHSADIRQMKRTAVTVPNKTLYTTTSYEGVSLDELVPDARKTYTFEVFKKFWAFHDRRILNSSQLDLNEEIIIADSANGRPLGGDNPFYLVARKKTGEFVLVRDVANLSLSAAKARVEP